MSYDRLVLGFKPGHHQRAHNWGGGGQMKRAYELLDSLVQVPAARQSSWRGTAAISEARAHFQVCLLVSSYNRLNLLLVRSADYTYSTAVFLLVSSSSRRFLVRPTGLIMHVAGTGRPAIIDRKTNLVQT